VPAQQTFPACPMAFSNQIGNQTRSWVSARLARLEPIERADPDEVQVMTWRIPGPGGRVRDCVAPAAIGWIARGTGVDAGCERGPVQLKRCLLYRFFLAAARTPPRTRSDAAQDDRS
jgi:hypothetical protein